MTSPKEESLAKLKDAVQERKRYGDVSFMSPAENTTAKELKENNAKYHSECYKSVTNKAKIDRLKEKVNPFPSPVNSEVEVNENEEQPTKKLRSQSISYDRLCCIICQNKGGKLHQVM